VVKRVLLTVCPREDVERVEPLLRQVRHARNPNDVPLNDVVTTILELVDP